MFRHKNHFPKVTPHEAVTCDYNKEMVFPWEIKRVEPKDAEERRKHFLDGAEVVLVGPKKYVCPPMYDILEASKIYNMSLRASDIFVVSTPRSGTTWIQELTWLVVNNLNYKEAATKSLGYRYTFLEYFTFFDEITIHRLNESNLSGDNLKHLEHVMKPSRDILPSLPSPRFVKTHLPMSLLPPSLLNTAKVVYISRDPRDVAVSYFHFTKLAWVSECGNNFKIFWNLFMKDLIEWMPFFEHVKEAWKYKDHPNMLFLFYEDLITDLPGTVRRVANFFNKQYNDDEIAGLCEHLTFDNFKKNNSITPSYLNGNCLLRHECSPFVRKGKAGGWQDYFDKDMAQQAEKWISDNLQDTDLRFPQVG